MIKLTEVLRKHVPRVQLELKDTYSFGKTAKLAKAIEMYALKSEKRER